MIEKICKTNVKGFLTLTLDTDCKYSVVLEHHHITLIPDENGILCSEKKTLKVQRVLLDAANLKDEVRVIVSSERIDIYALALVGL